MSRLDLISETCAPIVIGLMIGYMSKNAYVSNRNSFLIVAAWNWATSPIEYLLLRSIWNRVPQLRTAGRSCNASKEFTGGENPFLIIYHTWRLFSYAKKIFNLHSAFV